MTRDEKKAKDRWEYVSDRLCNSDYPIYNEEHELESAFDAGVKWCEEHPNWISVEDELPPKESEYEDNSIVVLATDGNDVYKGLYRSGEYLSGWFTCDLWGLDDITHWMPLPQPPKKGD